jgi:hypothetical protein
VIVRDNTALFFTVLPVTEKAESITTSTLSCTIDSPITEDSLQPTNEEVTVAKAAIARALLLLFIFRNILRVKTGEI